MTPPSPAANHAETAEEFTRRVEGVQSGGWDAPSPVAGWTARDVVGHLTTWFPAFLATSSDVSLPEGPAVEDDPVAAWKAQTAQIQTLLDDPASANRMVSNPHIGEMPLPQAVDMIYTGDVFLHTWDLARATGQDETLDEARCQAMYEGMLPMDAVLRSSGQYGPRVDVPADASYQDKLIGFIGRQP